MPRARGFLTTREAFAPSRGLEPEGHFPGPQRGEVGQVGEVSLNLAGWPIDELIP